MSGYVMYGLLAVLLLVGSGYDIRCRRIPLWLLAGALIATVVLVLIQGNPVEPLRLWGIVPGIVIGVVGKVTKAVGSGDSLLIFLLGYALGAWELFVLLSVAFALLAAVSVVLLVMKKIGRKGTLPFFPFALAGYVCLLLSK